MPWWHRARLTQDKPWHQRLLPSSCCQRPVSNRSKGKEHYLYLGSIDRRMYCISIKDLNLVHTPRLICERTRISPTIQFWLSCKRTASLSYVETTVLFTGWATKHWLILHHSMFLRAFRACDTFHEIMFEHNHLVFFWEPVWQQLTSMHNIHL